MLYAFRYRRDQWNNATVPKRTFACRVTQSENVNKKRTENNITVYRVRQRSISLKTVGNISPTTDNFKIKFYKPIVSQVRKIKFFYSTISLTLTKFCHSRRDHLVNSCISLKMRKLRYPCNRQYDRSPKNRHEDKMTHKSTLDTTCL